MTGVPLLLPEPEPLELLPELDPLDPALLIG
jgi:hypothetical protein